MRKSLQYWLLVLVAGVVCPVARGQASPVELVGRDADGNWTVRSGELFSPDKLRPVPVARSGAEGQVQIPLGAPVQLTHVAAQEPGPIYADVLTPFDGQVTSAGPALVAPPPAPTLVGQPVDPAGNPARDNRLMIFGVFAQPSTPGTLTAPGPGILVGSLEGTVQLGTQPPVSNPIPASVWLFVTGLAALGWAGRKIRNGAHH